MPDTHNRTKISKEDLIPPSGAEYAYAELVFKKMEQSDPDHFNVLKISRSKEKKQIKMDESILSELDLPHDFKLTHSFIKIDNKIFALAVHDILGDGSFGRVKHCWDEWGNILAYKAERLSPGFNLEESKLHCVDSDKAAIIAEQYIASGFIQSDTTDEFYDNPKSLKSSGHIVKKITIMPEAKGVEVYDYFKDFKKNNGKEMDHTDFLIVFYGIMNSLSDLHKKNVLHLDVKPANFRIDDDLSVTPIDFGFSTVLKKSEEYQTKQNRVGTYLSKEVMDHVYCKKTDIYAAAVSLFGGIIYKTNGSGRPILTLITNKFFIESMFSEKLQAMIKNMKDEKIEKRPTAQEVSKAILAELKTQHKDDPKAKQFLLDLKDKKPKVKYQDLTKGQKISGSIGPEPEAPPRSEEPISHPGIIHLLVNLFSRTHSANISSASKTRLPGPQ